MKKKILICLASLAMVGCVQEKFDTSDNAPIVASFEASREAFGGVSTRTVLVDGCCVEWIKDDAVAVFDGKGTYAFKADKSGPKAIFGTTDEGFDASAEAYTFVYPYVEGCVVDASKVQFTLASEQKAVLNSFDPAYGLAVAKANGLSQTVRFENPLSLLKFTVPAALDGRVTKITVKGNGASDVLGGQLLCDYSGATPVASLSANGISQMSLVSTSGMASGDYYLAVLPGTVQGLTLTVTVAGKNYPRLTNADTDKTFKPGYIHDMGEVSISEGTLLDVAFRADGTAYDRSAYGRTVKYVPKAGCLSVYKNYNFGGYVANFKPTTMGDNFVDGYYDFDYSTNTDFKNDLADGHSLEVLFRLDKSVSSYAKEVKILASQGSGGTGIIITKSAETNATKNAILFLPHVGGAYKYTDSKIVPETGVYYHVVGVYDKSAQKTHIYVNGELKGSVNTTGNYKDPSNALAQWFCIGGDAGTKDGKHCGECIFNGDIAIARVYSEPLAASKVAELYNEARRVIAPVPNPSAKIIAHKGYHPGDVPENSLEALIKAQELGVYGSEFDVWMTLDSKVVVYHDKTVAVNGASKKVYECTYAELKAAVPSLATLEEFLEQGKKCPAVKLICEIKYHDDGDRTVAAAEACHALVSAAGMTAQVEYISVNAAALKRLAVLSPGVMLQDVNSDYPMDRATAVAAGIKGINYDFNKLTDAQIADAHEKGMVVGTWTVDKEEDMRTMINRGVDFITTDEPVLLQQVLETL